MGNCLGTSKDLGHNQEEKPTLVKELTHSDHESYHPNISKSEKHHYHVNQIHNVSTIGVETEDSGKRNVHSNLHAVDLTQSLDADPSPGKPKYNAEVKEASHHGSIALKEPSVVKSNRKMKIEVTEYDGHHKSQSKEESLPRSLKKSNKDGDGHNNQNEDNCSHVKLSTGSLKVKIRTSQKPNKELEAPNSVKTHSKNGSLPKKKTEQESSSEKSSPTNSKEERDNKKVWDETLLQNSKPSKFANNYLMQVQKRSLRISDIRSAKLKSRVSDTKDEESSLSNDLENDIDFRAKLPMISKLKHLHKKRPVSASLKKQSSRIKDKETSDNDQDYEHSRSPKHAKQMTKKQSNQFDDLEPSSGSQKFTAVLVKSNSRRSSVDKTMLDEEKKPAKSIFSSIQIPKIEKQELKNNSRDISQDKESTRLKGAVSKGYLDIDEFESKYMQKVNPKYRAEIKEKIEPLIRDHENQVYEDPMTVYVGPVRDGEMHGQGAQIWTDCGINTGHVYMGNFVRGVRTGLGTLYYTDGDKFEGAFINAKPNARGVSHWKDGHVTNEKWKNGDLIKSTTKN